MNLLGYSEASRSMLEKGVDGFWFTIYELSELDKTPSTYHSELVYQSPFQPKAVSLGFYSTVELAISQSIAILGEQGITADSLRSSDLPYHSYIQIKQHLIQ